MSGLIKKIQNQLEEIPNHINHFKVLYSEKKAIKRKRNLYKDIQCTEQQTESFEKYWKNHYGINISNRWHRLYQSMNGVFCKDYFPEILYTTELEPEINPDAYTRFFNDKSIVEHLYSQVKDIRFPKTIITCCNGAYRDGQNHLVKKKESNKLLKNIGPCIIKPTVITGSGKDVELLNLKDGLDIRTGKTISRIISEHGKDFIIQEIVKNSEAFSKIYPKSLNTIRLITYLVDSEVHYAPLVMRIGVGGNEVDNIHAGGLCIGVNDDGTLKTDAYQLGYGDTAIKYRKHPDTGMIFENYYIGDVQKLISAAKNLHAIIPHVGMVSWDLTFDENNEVVLIEANCKDQSVWFPQIVHGQPLFGEDTPYMLKKIYKRRKI